MFVDGGKLCSYVAYSPLGSSMILSCKHQVTIAFDDVRDRFPNTLNNLGHIKKKKYRA